MKARFAKVGVEELKWGQWGLNLEWDFQKAHKCEGQVSTNFWPYSIGVLGVFWLMNVKLHAAS